jgi:hypothetical protein
MRFVKNLTVAAVLLAGLTFAASADATGARMGDCIQKGSQVTSAIEAAQPGQAADTARDLARSARQFCANGMYDRGVALYTKALSLLGK